MLCVFVVFRIIGLAFFRTFTLSENCLVAASWVLILVLPIVGSPRDALNISYNYVNKDIDFFFDELKLIPQWICLIDSSERNWFLQLKVGIFALLESSLICLYLMGNLLVLTKISKTAHYLSVRHNLADFDLNVLLWLSLDVISF